MPNGDSQQLANEQLRLAENSLNENNYDFCLQLCSNVLNAVGPLESVYSIASDAYISMKKFQQGEVCTLHALCLSEEPRIKYYINLSTFASMRKDLKLAFHYLYKAASLDPNHPGLDSLRSNLNDLSKQMSQFNFNQQWSDKKLSRVNA